MKRKKYISNWTIIGIGLAALIIIVIAGVMLVDQNNDSDVARWFKVNMFPADEFATVSIMDTNQQSISSTEYRGSTSSAWALSMIVSAIALLIGIVILARERGYFA